MILRNGYIELFPVDEVAADRVSPHLIRNVQTGRIVLIEQMIALVRRIIYESVRVVHPVLKGREMELRPPLLIIYGTRILFDYGFYGIASHNLSVSYMDNEREASHKRINAYRVSGNCELIAFGARVKLRGNTALRHARGI